MSNRVNLDNNNRPISWGEDVQGRDIPTPPNPAHEYVWDDTVNRWVHDQPARSEISSMSDDEVSEALRDGRLTAEEYLAHLIEVSRL
jgi:hypothetical protein